MMYSGLCLIAFFKRSKSVISLTSPVVPNPILTTLESQFSCCSCIEDDVGRYGLVFPVPYVQRYAEPVARNIFDPRVPHHRVYLVKEDEVPGDVVHYAVEAIGSDFDLVVLDDLLDHLSNVCRSILVAT